MASATASASASASASATVHACSPEDQRCLRAILRGTQQVMCTGCPGTCRRFAMRALVTSAGRNLWRVDNWPLPPTLRAPCVRWSAALLRTLGYYAAQEDGRPECLLVGFPEASRGRATTWGLVRTPLSPSLPAFLRAGDLVPAFQAMHRLARARRALTMRKFSTWMPPLKACAVQCLETLWWAAARDQALDHPAHLLTPIVSQQGWPRDMGVALWDMARVPGSAHWAGSAHALPWAQWCAALLVSIRTLPSGREAEEPGLRARVAHHVFEHMRQWAASRHCALITFQNSDILEEDPDPGTVSCLLLLALPECTAA